MKFLKRTLLLEAIAQLIALRRQAEPSGFALSQQFFAELAEKGADRQLSDGDVNCWMAWIADRENEGLGGIMARDEALYGAIYSETCRQYKLLVGSKPE